MTPSLLIRGLPTSLARDGWWLDAAPPSDPERPDKSAAARLPPMLGLLLLVVVADLLFWNHRLGISVAVFAVAMFTVATAGSLLQQERLLRNGKFRGLHGSSAVLGRESFARNSRFKRRRLHGQRGFEAIATRPL